MSPKFDAYLIALQNRDTTLVMLAGIAAAVVLGWILVEYIPWPRVRSWIKLFFQIGSVPLWIVTLFVAYLTSP